MSLKTRVIVLKRIRAGDQDLLAKVYGQGGVLDLLVRDAYLNTCRFFGVFEPFNLVEVDLTQRGSIVIPNDVGKVERLSFLARDFDRFLWMSWVARFILRNVSFYDEKLFDLFLRYILERTEGAEHLYRVKLKLDYLNLSGLRPKFLEERFGRGRLRVKLSDGSVRADGDYEVESYILRFLVKVWRAKRLKNLNIKEETALDMERFLDALIEYHTR